MIPENQTKISAERSRYSGFLEKNGFKFTLGRSRVFETVMKAHGHFAPEEIVKICQKNKTKVSRATIYRSITELLESGVIRLTAFGEKHHHFEHLYDAKPHHHARCIRCSEIIEFKDLGEDKVYHKVLTTKGFKVLGHEMHFYGICQKCQNS